MKGYMPVRGRMRNKVKIGTRDRASAKSGSGRHSGKETTGQEGSKDWKHLGAG